MSIAHALLGIPVCRHGRYYLGLEFWAEPFCCPTAEKEIRQAATLGFIGPLPECDQHRCPACALDPLDVTLHREDCPILQAGRCGCISPDGAVCLIVDEFTTDGRWVAHEHAYTELGRQ